MELFQGGKCCDKNVCTGLKIRTDIAYVGLDLINCFNIFGIRFIVGSSPTVETENRVKRIQTYTAPFSVSSKQARSLPTNLWGLQNTINVQ